MRAHTCITCLARARDYSSLTNNISFFGLMVFPEEVIGAQPTMESISISRMVDVDAMEICKALYWSAFV